MSSAQIFTSRPTFLSSPDVGSQTYLQLKNMLPISVRPKDSELATMLTEKNVRMFWTEVSTDLKSYVFQVYPPNTVCLRLSAKDQCGTPVIMFVSSDIHKHMDLTQNLPFDRLGDIQRYKVMPVGTYNNPTDLTKKSMPAQSGRFRGWTDMQGMYVLPTGNVCWQDLKSFLPTDIRALHEGFPLILCIEDVHYCIDQLGYTIQELQEISYRALFSITAYQARQ